MLSSETLEYFKRIIKNKLKNNTLEQIGRKKYCSKDCPHKDFCDYVHQTREHKITLAQMKALLRELNYDLKVSGRCCIGGECS